MRLRICGEEWSLLPTGTMSAMILPCGLSAARSQLRPAPKRATASAATTSQWRWRRQTVIGGSPGFPVGAAVLLCVRRHIDVRKFSVKIAMRSDDEPRARGEKARAEDRRQGKRGKAGRQESG